MQPEEYTFDLQRIFIGEFPSVYYLEILIRVIILYLYTYFVFRLLGKRSGSSLSFVDALLVIALGSAVGDPMFYPGVSVLAGIAVITVIALINFGIEKLSLKSQSIYNFIKTTPVIVVEKGEINKKELKKQNMSDNEIFVMLRKEGIESLNQVDRAILEPTGELSVYKNNKKKDSDELFQRVD